MSLEDDPLLNSTSRTLRSVQLLNCLNRLTEDTCNNLYLLHLDNILQINLSLREPNPQHFEDHVAVCQGLHEFAIMSNKLASQFQLYSQARLMDSGFGSDNNSTAQAKLASKDSPCKETSSNEMC